MKINTLCRLVISIVTLTVLAGCNLPSGGQSGSATLDITQAYATVQTRLTAAATLTPPVPVITVTVEPTQAATAIVEATATQPPAEPTKTQPPAATSAPQVQCDQASPGNPIDVTVPDNTQFAPGQSFTKTWRLTNSGTCTWSKEYTLELFSGEKMGAPASVALTQNVAPGQSIDISVDMVAPSNPGTYQGNWKLRNAAKTWFGIGPGGVSPFWVRIVVAGSGTATVAPTASTPHVGTLTPIPTILPVTATATTGSGAKIKVSGTVSLTPGDQLDFDSNILNSGGMDVSYEKNNRNKPILSPLGATVLGMYTDGQPSYEDCQSASLSPAPISGGDLSVGTYICYRTGDGRLGRLLVIAYNMADLSITFDVLTWQTP